MHRLFALGICVVVLGCGSSTSDRGGAAGTDLSGGNTGGDSSVAGQSGAASGAGRNGAASGAGASGGSPIPTPVGAVGITALDCQKSGAASSTCEVGQVCCDGSHGFGATMCVAAFTDCPCADRGSCVAWGCKSPADCPGQKCCLRYNAPLTFPEFDAASCKTSCDPSTEAVLCAIDADCPTPACSTSSLGVKRCF